MILAASIAFVGLTLVLALWDALRRALASQVRTAELRVEAMKRVDYEAAMAALRVLEARINTIESNASSLETAIALGRQRR